MERTLHRHNGLDITPILKHLTRPIPPQIDRKIPPASRRWQPITRPVPRWRDICCLHEDLERLVAGRIVIAAAVSTNTVDETAISVGQVTPIAERVPLQWIRDQKIVFAVCGQGPEAIDGWFG